MTMRSCPVLNKIDLPAAEPDRIKEQIEDVIGLDASEAIEVSAKTGQGIEEVLEAIVHQLPAPFSRRTGRTAQGIAGGTAGTMRISGVIVLVRVIDGQIKKGQTIKMMGTDAKYLIDRVGIMDAENDPG